MTGAIARIVMLWWDGKFLEKVKAAGIEIEMYGRYIDDTNIVSEVVKPGWRFCKEMELVVFKEEWLEEDRNTEDDRRTALVIRDIANTIHPMIQMEEDFPSNYRDGKLPILDLKCWIARDGLVWFQHYKKPAATKMVLSAQSALPMKQKRNIHINECVRRLRN